MDKAIVNTLFVESGAEFSPCEKYRYTLMRKWGAGNRMVNFAMLNPSVADQYILDPTLSRCMIRAEQMGFDGFHVTNLFAWRSTDPGQLALNVHRKIDPIGSENDAHILRIALLSEMVICGWGSASPLIPARAAQVVAMLREAGVKLWALKVSDRTGMPMHPLYRPYSELPQLWVPN